MFIRKTRIINRLTKKSYHNYQLVESFRTERGPRQRILLNLGAELDLDQKECKCLANRIEELLRGVHSLLSCPEKIEKYAEQFASKIQRELTRPLQTINLKTAVGDGKLRQSFESESFSAEGHIPQVAKGPSVGNDSDSKDCVNLPSPTAVFRIKPEPCDYHNIDLNTMEQQEPRSVGVEHVLLHFAGQLRIPQKLKELGFSDKEVALSLGSIIARAAFPASERATHAWLTQKSGLGELINFDFQKTKLDSLYSISDLLLKHKKSLEHYLEVTQQSCHGYKSTMVLYDLTNTYMEGRARGNAKAKFGVSKEKRADCPLVTLGLVINEHGFATRSSFLPGNIAEPTTLQEAMTALDNPGALFRPVVVLDAGIASEANLKWLRDQKYQYVVSARQKAPSMELQGKLVSVGAVTSEVQVAFIKSDGEEEQWLYCESAAKEAVSSQMKKRFQDRFEADLNHLATGILKPRGRKRHLKVIERIGRLREKHRAVSGCYDITVEASTDGEQAVKVNWLLKPEKLEDRLHGHYFLRTNLVGYTPEQIWHLYGNLRTVEEAFRFMKSSLGLRPIYHQKEKRVDGHLWITILAYHLIQGCMHRLKNKGLCHSWETIRNQLANRMRVTMRAKKESGQMLYCRSTTQVEAQQRPIYESLELSTQILKNAKAVI